jgi:hypothetical protein
MIKIPAKFKWSIIIVIAIILVGQIPYNWYKAKPVIKYNNLFLSSMMSDDSVKLVEFSKSYPGKELFFIERLRKIDSTFGIVKKFEMLKIRKTFSKVYFTTYRVDFDKSSGCTAMFEIQADSHTPLHYRLGEIDIRKKETNQYVSVRPLRERL